ncbi:MAG: response regulator, partial [Pseudomonadales bacterium]|nr:response regulator [Pseudomonadales bacterium]
KLELNNFAYEPRSLVDNVRKMLGVVALNKGINLDLRVADEVPEAWIGDQSRVQQVIINLVGNAIKFTSEGSIVIEVSVLEKSTARSLLFKVVDTGNGIQQDKLALIFSPYAQENSGISSRYGGTGLGLSISKQLVDLMEGEIGVESVLGEGSTFWFKVPLAKEVIELETDKLLPEKLSEGEADASLSEETGGVDKLPGCLNVLIAEDDPINQTITRKMVEMFGHHVYLVDNGVDAVQIFESSRIDLVLMDCYMPVMDGYEATRKIRELEADNQHTPIIALSAQSNMKAREASAGAGMDQHLDKPLNRVKLHKLMHDLVTPRAVH